MTIKSSKTLVDEAMRKIKTYNPQETKELYDKKNSILIDIRDIREIWNEGTIDGALHMPRGMLEFWFDPSSPYFKKEKFDDSSKNIILFCAGGLRSALATKTLNDMGYKNVGHVEGGFSAMKLTGFNIVKKDKK